MALIAVLSSGISCGLIYAAMQKKSYETARANAVNYTRNIQFRVRLLLSENMKIVRALAGLREVSDFLVSPNHSGLENVNQALDTFKQALNIDVCYLMNRNGLTLAASNRGTPESFVGKNYAFRPYFQEALKGHAAVYMAIGVTSGKRGIYFSCPVYDASASHPMGTVVIKSSTMGLQHALSNSFSYHTGISLLMDPHGFIFLSDPPGYEGQLFWRSKQDTVDAIIASRQFGDGPWSWSGMQALKNGNVGDAAGNQFLIHTAKIDLYPGWQIIHLSNLRSIVKTMSHPIIKTFLPFAVSVSLLISLSVFLLYKQARKDLNLRNRLQSELKRQTEYLAMLHNVSLGVLNHLEIDELLKSILKRTCELFRTRHAYFYLLEPDGRHMRMRLGTGGRFNQMQDFLIKPGQGISGEVWVSGKAKRIDGYRQWPNRILHPALDIFNSIIAVPVLAEDKVTGILGIGLIGETDESTQEMIDILKRFSELVAISLANAYLFSEANRALKELEKSEIRFRSVIEKNADAIMVVDKKGIIQFANSAAKNLFNRGNGNLIGSPFGFPITAGEGTEIEVLKQDGTGAIAEMRLVETEWEGEMVYFASLRDISERILAEKERKMLEQKLQQSQKMEAIGTLAGGIAHDFNNILSAVIGFSEVSLDLVEQGSQLHLNIKEVLNAGNRAKELVRQILSFSRQSEQEPSPIQVSHLAKEILKLLRASLPTTIEIRQCMNSEKLVLADATQIHQVLMNLCTNAGFAMKDSGGILTLTVADVDENETLPFEHSGDPTTSYQRISVSDTGRGIDTRYLDRIFDPFFTTKEKGEGTGMGLSVAHGIIQDHGGNITVENFPGQGVTFHVYLPVITEQMKNGPQKKDDLLPRGDEHILFVDDEPPLTKIGKQMLERLGYTVIDVTDSSEALSMVKSDPDRFDLIITDLTMPSMTGTMLAKEVLRIRPDLPIIISTGYSGELTDEAMKSSGIRALLMKPLLKKEMAITVRKVLDSRNAD
jgi:C4-dicarboxylate-specific signal transduction histidine kinase/ActR/RegA family two-component response regulator